MTICGLLPLVSIDQAREAMREGFARGGIIPVFLDAGQGPQVRQHTVPTDARCPRSAIGVRAATGANARTGMFDPIEMSHDLLPKF
jgi:hypothetical protein